jgi:hypothetical protein
MPVHSSATRSKNTRTEEPPTRRPLLRFVRESRQRILSNWQQVRCLCAKPVDKGQRQSLLD